MKHQYRVLVVFALLAIMGCYIFYLYGSMPIPVLSRKLKEHLHSLKPLFLHDDSDLHEAAFQTSTQESKQCKDVEIYEYCDEECTWLKQQCERKRTIRDTCARYRLNQNETQRMMLQHFLVSDLYNTIYCYVPKVACTTWKRVLLLMNGNNVKDVHSAPIPNLSQFSKAGIERRIRNYKKFIIVRNPHVRLLSAYLEKFVGVSGYNDHILEYYGRRIRIQNVKKLVDTYYQSDLNMSNAFLKWKKEINNEAHVFITFQELIRYVGDSKNRLNEDTEIHWREINRLCNPCAVNFDFIGELETAANDSKYILKQIGATHLITEANTNKKHVTNSSGTNNVLKAFKTVTEKDILQFEKRFEKDFALFGYQRPSVITKLKSEDEDFKDNMELLESIKSIN